MVTGLGLGNTLRYAIPASLKDVTEADKVCMAAVVRDA